MSQFSGEWRAAKDLLRKTTTAVIDKTAALPISAVLQRTGLVPGGSASIQHVPGPEEQHVIPIRQQVQAPSAQGLLATCVLVLLSFMLGSWWGARHQRSRQAMLQAQAADQQTEELANISLTSTSSTDSKQLSKAHAHGVPLPDTMADSEQGQSSSNAAQHKPISAVELPEQADTGMQSAKQDSQESDDSMQQQDPTSSQESKSLTAQDDDQTALQNQDHTASRQSAPASTVHQDAHETEASSHSPNQTSFSTSALTLPWTGAAQAHHDPIGAAAGRSTVSIRRLDLVHIICTWG